MSRPGDVQKRRWRRREMHRLSKTVDGRGDIGHPSDRPAEPLGSAVNDQQPPFGQLGPNGVGLIPKLGPDAGTSDAGHGEQPLSAAELIVKWS